MNGRRNNKPDLLGAMLENLGPLGQLGAVLQLPTGRTAKVEQYIGNGRTVLLRYQDEDRSQLTLSLRFVKKLKVVGGEYV